MERKLTTITAEEWDKLLVRWKDIVGGVLFAENKLVKNGTLHRGIDADTWVSAIAEEILRKNFKTE